MIYVQYKAEGKVSQSWEWTGQARFREGRLCTAAGFSVTAGEKEAVEIAEACCGLRSLRHGGVTVWTGEDALFILNNFAADK